MQTKWFARAGIGLFAAVAITATFIDMRAEPGPVFRSAASETHAVAADPLRRELVRCQSIGAAGAGDLSCLRAWAENRRRFLGSSARAENRGADVEDAVAATTTAGGANMAASQLAGGQ